MISSSGETYKPPLLDLRRGVPIGTHCQFKVGLRKHNSVFRGFHFPKYILADIPQTQGKHEVLMKDSVFWTLFLHRGVIYYFETTLIKAYTKPLKLWAISFPAGRVKHARLRTSERINVLLPARIITDTSEAKGVLVNLSMGGGLFVTDPATNGSTTGKDTGALEVALPGMNARSEIAARVCSVTKRDNKVFMGLCFEDMEGSDYTSIKSFYEDCALSGV